MKPTLEYGPHHTYRVSKNDDLALEAWALACNMSVYHLVNDIIVNALADRRKEKRLSAEHYTARHGDDPVEYVE